jgi:hypothetical protein
MWRSRPAGLQPPIVDRDNINQRFRVPPLHSAFTGKGFAGQRSVLRPESAQTNPDQPIERIGAKVRSRPQHQSIDLKEICRAALVHARASFRQFGGCIAISVSSPEEE